jgi:pimeloyl-ACP methyl ester carboxylesterase
VAIGALVLGIAIALAAALGLLRGATPEFELQGCRIGEWSARCGRIAVPEDPSAPQKKKISLNVAVMPATGGTAKPDPLFWFAGWGSGGVSDDAANVLSALRRVNIDRDVVFIDQRGTGGSKVECPLVSEQRPLSAGSSAVTAAARRCAEKVPGLRYYTSAVAVDDIDRIRRALGYRTINIYGGSYGATTGQIYLLRHGSHVRTAVFDGGSLLDVRIFERVAPNAQHALGLLFARCAADTACRTAYPRLRRDFAAAQARVASTDVRVPGTTARLDPAAFANVVEELLASSDGKAILPRFIHLIATGQIARAAKLVSGAVTDDTSELAAQLLIECSEPWASRRPTKTERAADGTFFAPAAQRQARLVGAACNGLPTAAVPAAIGRRVHSRAPVLFLTGDEDPADPPANVAHAKRELPNSRTVTFRAAGHIQLGLLCAQNLIADFIASGTAAGLDSACAETAVKPFFDYAG